VQRFHNHFLPARLKVKFATINSKNMAKDRERRTAHILYVEQKKTAKEVAELVGVSEKTMSDWVTKHNWKAERDARSTSPTQRINNIEAIIGGLAQDRLDLQRKLETAEKNGNKDEVVQLRSDMSKLDDSVSKWNKTLRDINKESKVPLGVYLNVMESIFNSLQAFDPKLHFQTIAFQEKHIHEMSIKLGM
jgi:predicted transcriptional regulator